MFSSPTLFCNELERLYIGRQKALKLLATSAKISASEALELGLVDEIVSNSDESTGQVERLYLRCCVLYN